MSWISVGEIVDWILIVGVFLGAVPLVANTALCLLVGLRRWNNHYDLHGSYQPRTAVLIPAWNEGAVIEASVERLLALHYPPDLLRVVVVDDASTDDTAAIVKNLSVRNPGRVVHLRRDEGGQGKAHALNEGIQLLLGDSWMQALLIMDADVIYERESLLKMTYHLADPEVGAVTAYIKEGSRGGTITRFVAHEYLLAQAVARRAQDALGAVACLAGGAQLISRANLEAIGGRIDTGSLAEDTVTTFKTQLGGRRVVFEGNAVVWAEEPSTLRALWKQRMRWARGNIDVTVKFRKVWFRRSSEHGLGGILFGLNWWSLLLLPAFMVISSIALVLLYFLDYSRSFSIFHSLWIVDAVCFVFLVVLAWAIDPATAKRSWRQALLFPGLVSLAVVVWSLFPKPVSWLIRRGLGVVDVRLGPWDHWVIFGLYVWVAGCMVLAYLAKAVEDYRLRSAELGRWASRVLLYVAGFGAFLCAVTVVAYSKQLRRADATWEKTEKLGRVSR